MLHTTTHNSGIQLAYRPIAIVFSIPFALLASLLLVMTTATPAQAQITGEIPDITGVVFSDIDGDGEQDPGEEGIPGITVTLENSTGVLDEETTAGDGSYGFNSRVVSAEDEYFVRVHVPEEGYTPTTPITVPVPVNGDLPVTIDFGLQPETGTITGVIFDDRNRNGVQDPGEPGIAGATVNLLASTSSASHVRSEHEEIIQTTVTDQDGVFVFTNVLPGSYIIEAIPPEGFTGTTPERQPITLEPGEEVVVPFGKASDDTLVFLPSIMRN
jgi:serine-aspartate repeat-containing protein C/D/E